MQSPLSYRHRAIADHDVVFILKEALGYPLVKDFRQRLSDVVA